MITVQAVVGAHLVATVAGARVLADGGDDDLGAGFIAFMVVLAMSVGCYFLFRSMSRHLKKVPATFEGPEPVEPGVTPAKPVES